MRAGFQMIGRERWLEQDRMRRVQDALGVHASYGRLAGV
jgi:hypothetical protein